MADGTTYGVNFPFGVSPQGYYVSLSQTTDEEIRSSLLHLILTRKGTRFFLPDFGTRIYEFIFDPLDGETFEGIKSEIQEQVEKYIPNLIINDITVTPYLESEIENEDSQEIDNTFNVSYNRGSITTILPSDGFGQQPSYANDDIFRLPGANTQEYTAKLKIDYVNNNNAFGSSEFIIINI